MPVTVYVHVHMSGVTGSQTRASDLSELELQAAVNCLT